MALVIIFHPLFIHYSQPFQTHEHACSLTLISITVQTVYNNPLYNTISIVEGSQLGKLIFPKKIPKNFASFFFFQSFFLFCFINSLGP